MHLDTATLAIYMITLVIRTTTATMPMTIQVIHTMITVATIMITPVTQTITMTTITTIMIIRTTIAKQAVVA